MLISQVVDSLCASTQGLWHSAYIRMVPLSTPYHPTITRHKSRKMSGRGGERMHKPSLITCRREVDEVLKASHVHALSTDGNAFNSRKRCG